MTIGKIWSNIIKYIYILDISAQDGLGRDKRNINRKYSNDLNIFLSSMF